MQPIYHFKALGTPEDKLTPTKTPEDKAEVLFEVCLVF